MIEKRLQIDRYVPVGHIEYLRDYRRRLVEFLCSFNEYKVRRYAKKLTDEIDKIDICIDRYYKEMEETFFNVIVKDFEVCEIEVEPNIEILQSKCNPKKKRKK